MVAIQKAVLYISTSKRLANIFCKGWQKQHLIHGLQPCIWSKYTIYIEDNLKEPARFETRTSRSWVECAAIWATMLRCWYSKCKPYCCIFSWLPYLYSTHSKKRLIKRSTQVTGLTYREKRGNIQKLRLQNWLYHVFDVRIVVPNMQR